MPVSDLDIARSVHPWIQQHGDQTTAKAREMVEEMRRKGDAGDADTWLRIIVAIGELGTTSIAVMQNCLPTFAGWRTALASHQSSIDVEALPAVVDDPLRED